MDLNAGTNIMDSSVRSFVQSELHPENQCFSRLPNELVAMILTKLELYNEIHKLVRLRLVSSLWQTLIDDFCMRRKCLIVHEILSTSSVGRRFFDFVNLNHFTFLCLNRRVSGDLLGPLLKAFPNIEHCSMSLLAPNLARLEQFSYLRYEPSLIGHFGLNCSRVCLDFLNEENLTQWHTINGQWLANVTHLDLKSFRELERIIEYLSKHATALQVLRLEGTMYYTRMTPQLIGDLSKFKHLTETELSYILFDWPQLEEAARKFEAHSTRIHSNIHFLARQFYWPKGQQSSHFGALHHFAQCRVPHF